MTETERAAHLWRWMWLGVAGGVIYTATFLTYPWTAGEEAFGHNVGSTVASAFIGGLLGRGACWLWLRHIGR